MQKYFWLLFFLAILYFTNACTDHRNTSCEKSQSLNHIRSELSLRNLESLSQLKTDYASLRYNLREYHKVGLEIRGLLDTLKIIERKGDDISFKLQSLSEKIETHISAPETGELLDQKDSQFWKAFWHGENSTKNLGDFGNGNKLKMELVDYFQTIVDHYNYQMLRPEHDGITVNELMIKTCRCEVDLENNVPLNWVDYHFSGNGIESLCSLELIELSVYQAESLLIALLTHRVVSSQIPTGE